MGEGGKDWQKKGRFANLKNAQLLSEFPTSSHSLCLITALLYHLITHLASKTQNHQCPGLLVVLEINKGSHDWNTLQKLLFSSADARYIFYLKKQVQNKLIKFFLIALYFVKLADWNSACKCLIASGNKASSVRKTARTQEGIPWPTPALIRGLPKVLSAHAKPNTSYFFLTLPWQASSSCSAQLPVQVPFNIVNTFQENQPAPSSLPHTGNSERRPREPQGRTGRAGFWSVQWISAPPPPPRGGWWTRASELGSGTESPGSQRPAEPCASLK